MSRLETALGTFVERLARLGQRVALVGGLAVSARTEPRFTRDLDLVVAVTRDSEAEILVQRLVSEGYRARTLVEQEATGRLATVRLDLPAENLRGVVVDLLFASSGIEPEVVHDAEPLRLFATVVVPVARVGHLVALKLLARDDRARPQDQVDLRALRAVTDDTEIRRARQAVALIEERGFARGRDLHAALEAWLAVP
jgi:predicted nucleotidyltransferase